MLGSLTVKMVVVDVFVATHLAIKPKGPKGSAKTHRCREHHVSHDFPPPRDADVSLPFVLISLVGSIDAGPPTICEIYHAISVRRITVT